MTSKDTTPIHASELKLDPKTYGKLLRAVKKGDEIALQDPLKVAGWSDGGYFYYPDPTIADLINTVAGQANETP